MGWLDTIQGSIVCLDVAPIIYYVERNASYTKLIDPFFEAIQHNKFTAITSVTTLLEVLVYPIRRNDNELVQKYQSILSNARQINVLTVDRDVAEEAARLRAIHNLRTPDSIHMATALVSNAKYFLTNDLRLPSLSNLTVLKLDELKTRPEYTEQNDNQ
jgi:predicted nucleic acid-binding protein